MFRTMMKTRDDAVLAVLRIVVGGVFFAHGAQKMLGWFGGNGFVATMGFFTHGMGIPVPFAFLAICAEFLGGLGLTIGCMSRIAAAGIITNMVVAVVMVHGRNGLFMNWTGTQKGEGFEFHLFAIALAMAILINGGGSLSIDRLLMRRPNALPATTRAPSVPAERRN